MTTRPKRIPKNSIVGEQGIALIHQRVLEMGYLWYPTGGIEAGIDGLDRTGHGCGAQLDLGVARFAAAALQLGRRFIGIDIERRRIETTRRRIEVALSCIERKR
jgi:hypothetical protein